jgi:hypothetical protein
MKELIKQFRLALFVWIVQLAVFVLPKECKKTLRWIVQMPLED